MIVKRTTSSCLWRWMAGIGLLALGSTNANAARIDYMLPVEQQVASLDLGGVTVTGSNTLIVNDNHGLNVLGGYADFPYRDGTTDPSESLVFRFNDGPATAITLSLHGAGSWGTDLTGKAFITAFDQAGQALGTHELTASDFQLDISKAFGDLPIASFLLRPRGDARAASYMQVSALTYTPIPEPSTMALFGFVVLAAGLRKLARRSADPLSAD